MARQIEVNAAGAPGSGAVVTLYAIGSSTPNSAFLLFV